MTKLEQTDRPHRLSVVVPMYNEEESVAVFVTQMHEALADYRHPWELVLVNDGSSDSTEQQMRIACQQWGPHTRIINLQRNFGQTAAMQAGIDAARGDVIATMDGDMQNDPIDIPRMVKRLLEEDLDLVAGWRKDRQDTLMRKIPSRIANRLIGRITQVELHDYGCSLKVFRAAIIKSVRLYGEMHRFIPAWMAASTSAIRPVQIWSGAYLSRDPRSVGGVFLHAFSQPPRALLRQDRSDLRRIRGDGSGLSCLREDLSR